MSRSNGAPSRRRASATSRRRGRRSCGSRAGGSSRRPTRRARSSSATCTTAPSSSSSARCCSCSSPSARRRRTPTARGRCARRRSSWRRPAINELRRLAAGIHPAILTDRGLGPAVESLCLPPAVARGGHRDAFASGFRPRSRRASTSSSRRRSTNVVKHAQAHEATVSIGASNGGLTVEVCRRRRGRRAGRGRERSARPGRPRRRPRRDARRRQPAGRRDAPAGDDPARLARRGSSSAPRDRRGPRT